ncbi:hypothetical protein NXC24_PC01144 (plasmid) [Rhizobium sp. NXC24]|nr:hypothetical protein NXC24_PC01144 [Rhizobium sp. NXC24]
MAPNPNVPALFPKRPIVKRWQRCGTCASQQKTSCEGFTSNPLNGSFRHRELLRRAEYLSRATAVRMLKRQAAHRWIGSYQPNQSEAESAFSHCVRLSMQRFGALALI